MESPKNRPHCRLRKRLHMLRVCMAARESNPFCGGEAARSLSMSYVDVKSVGKVQAKMQSIKDMHPKLGMIFCRNNLRYSFPSGTSVTDIDMSSLCLVTCCFGTPRPAEIYFGPLFLSQPPPDLPLGENRTNWMRTWWLGGRLCLRRSTKRLPNYITLHNRTITPIPRHNCAVPPCPRMDS
jgi:hypothetical protein